MYIYYKLNKDLNILNKNEDYNINNYIIFFIYNIFE